MKSGIHPNYSAVKATCACGSSFETSSTQKELRVAVCSQCHPFYTGKRGSRVMNEAGRLEKFQKKYAGVDYGQKSKGD